MSAFVSEKCVPRGDAVKVAWLIAPVKHREPLLESEYLQNPSIVGYFYDWDSEKEILRLLRFDKDTVKRFTATGIGLYSARGISKLFSPRVRTIEDFYAAVRQLQFAKLAQGAGP